MFGTGKNHHQRNRTKRHEKGTKKFRVVCFVSFRVISWITSLFASVACRLKYE